MLNPADAISGLADLLDTSAVSVRYVTLKMQRDERQLWPRFGKGRKASVSFRSLLNLWLACVLSNGNPPAGVKAAYEFTRLKMSGETKREVVRSPTIPPEVNKLVWGGAQGYSTITETRNPFAAPAGDERWLIDLFEQIIRLAVEAAQSNGSNIGLNNFAWPAISVRIGNAQQSMSADVDWPMPDGQGVNVDHFTLKEALQPQPDLYGSQNLSAVPETRIVIRQNAVMAFASLAMMTEDFNDLLRQTSTVSPASGNGEGDTSETTEATGPASHGDLDVKTSTTRTPTALAPTASKQEQSATNQGTKQSRFPAAARESRIRQPATRKVLDNENWALAG